jgi:hypothetical protein
MPVFLVPYDAWGSRVVYNDEEPRLSLNEGQFRVHSNLDESSGNASPGNMMIFKVSF